MLQQPTLQDVYVQVHICEQMLAPKHPAETTNSVVISCNIKVSQRHSTVLHEPTMKDLVDLFRGLK